MAKEPLAKGRLKSVPRSYRVTAPHFHTHSSVNCCQTALVLRLSYSRPRLNRTPTPPDHKHAELTSTKARTVLCNGKPAGSSRHAAALWLNELNEPSKSQSPRHRWHPKRPPPSLADMPHVFWPRASVARRHASFAGLHAAAFGGRHAADSVSTRPPRRRGRTVSRMAGTRCGDHSAPQRRRSSRGRQAAWRRHHS